jgi:hypothetical protein
MWMRFALVGLFRLSVFICTPAYGLITPNMPRRYPSGPLAKNRLSLGPLAEFPPPNSKAHSPGNAMTLPAAFFKVPINAPVVGLKALMRPLPTLPTSKSLLNVPKVEGAIARPQGSFNGPPAVLVMSRFSTLVEGL